ncbi:MAG: alpha-L-fucosidase [Kiritimatiellae bacterium]|nr:alpha-L-fucosidase [Kiritimatiellia bacterium]
MRKIFAIAACAAAAFAADAATYEAKWESLDKRPTPSWWTDAKFGIFIHWGPYAVPAFAPVPEDGKFHWDCYAEWYQGKMLAGKKAFLDHHASHYGKAPYGNFAAAFRAENFDAAKWAKLFKQAGAKYVVLTSKHHDGFALWPSPESPYYNAVAMGPGRDLAAEFCREMRAAGLKRGFYFSMLEYANPLYPAIRDGKPGASALTIEEWNARVNFPQLKELAEKYEADVIWPDGEWDYPSARHCSEAYLAWLFNESKVKDSVVVNDRWGSDCRGRHGGHYTTEYVAEGGSAAGLSAVHPWEECRGIGNSFGYNRFETPAQYMSREKCVETLVKIVSAGGNLLLNVGPAADGRIPAVMQDRLLAMGRWLAVNGEAIYATTRWEDAPAALKEKRVYFTRKGDDLYAICFAWPKDLEIAKTGVVKSVTLLGSKAEVAWKAKDGGVVISPAPLAPDALPCEHAWAFKISR